MSARNEALYQQHEDKEQHNEVYRRLEAEQVGEPITYLRENAKEQNKERENHPEEGVLDSHLRLFHAPRNERRQDNGRDEQNCLQENRHMNLPIH